MQEGRVDVIPGPGSHGRGDASAFRIDPSPPPLSTPPPLFTEKVFPSAAATAKGNLFGLETFLNWVTKTYVFTTL